MDASSHGCIFTYRPWHGKPPHPMWLRPACPGRRRGGVRKHSDLLDVLSTLYCSYTAVFMDDAIEREVAPCCPAVSMLMSDTSDILWHHLALYLA